ncbi:phospho-N-acetylmuramoyl-pentapeptide-transferase [Deinococcus maricopensis]|uniref:Phospho-N-acetylmuramoyl-pentapeptide-transferase n=1 Tax=Deinococcus maricopensis (strain DSM 21211 / LMG 22137 / NRRL B-23946 / LB-34) TaxID=709986 RepID=E8U8B2_DEIML|nr:phospho-N-acetylmuramoyl-pentapeptide-transferase [Deinococcus maricopensis]ADV67301.1 Phospho-N-acetylmuramoyl-pentapeptide-transferase [Deinococcus maricopensis DSM 21211]
MIIAALLSWLMVGGFITASKRYGWGQTVRADGPESHLAKSGTPTAGGVGFVLAMLIVWLGYRVAGFATDPREALIVLAALGMGLIGLVDDVLKIRSRMRGSGKKELLAREKFPLQFLVGLAFAYFAAPLASHDLGLNLGRVAETILFTLVMIGSVNAFNFTDGLDGLLAGVSLIILLPLLVLSPAAALLAGALLGFLWFNAHPARVFMGDMGSHAIGALIAGAYILYADVWLLPVAAIIPVVEVLSVVMQVAYFRRTGGKRIFRMTPIHHHFELVGIPETQVTMRFWIVTAVGTAAAWWLLGGRP